MAARSLRKKDDAADHDRRNDCRRNWAAQGEPSMSQRLVKEIT
jgi:hypothetical protein